MNNQRIARELAAVARDLVAMDLTDLRGLDEEGMELQLEMGRLRDLEKALRGSMTLLPMFRPVPDVTLK